MRSQVCDHRFEIVDVGGRVSPECRPRSQLRDSCRVGFEPGEPCDDDEYDDDDDDDDNDDEYDGEYDDEYDDVPGQVCESRDLG